MEWQEISKARRHRHDAAAGAVVLTIAVIVLAGCGVGCVGDGEDVLGRADVQVAHIGGGRVWEDMRAESESGAAVVVVGSICGREGTQGAVLSFRIDSDEGMKEGVRFDKEMNLRLKLRRYDAGAARVRVHALENGDDNGHVRTTAHSNADAPGTTASSKEKPPDMKIGSLLHDVSIDTATTKWDEWFELRLALDMQTIEQQAGGVTAGERSIRVIVFSKSARLGDDASSCASSRVYLDTAMAGIVSTQDSSPSSQFSVPSQPRATSSSRSSSTFSSSVVVEIVDRPGGIASTSTAVLSFKVVDDANSKAADIQNEDLHTLCSLDGRAFEICTSPVLYSGLEDGRHAFAVKTNVDGAEPAMMKWVVDTTPPVASSTLSEKGDTLHIEWSEDVGTLDHSAIVVSATTSSGVTKSLALKRITDSKRDDARHFAFHIVGRTNKDDVVSVYMPHATTTDAAGNPSTAASDRIHAAVASSASTATPSAPATPAGNTRDRARWELAEYELHLSLHRDAVAAARRRDEERALLELKEEYDRAKRDADREAEAELERLRLASERERATIERDTARERAEAEAEGRIREARENEDIHLRELRARGESSRATAVAGIQAVIDGFVSTLKDTSAMRRLVLVIAGVLAALFFSKEASTYAREVVHSLLSKPSLLREVTYAGGFRRKVTVSGSRQGGAGEVVLAPSTRIRLEELTMTTASSKCQGAPFRNILFFGAPGTGKTMAARQLAEGVGLDCAVMTGGDVLPLGGDAVTQLHAVFRWARRSRRGLLLFIDEADAFLASRGRGSASGLGNGGDGGGAGTVAALNALLYHTGEQSRDFMLVLATNRPDALDEAILDRMDDSIEFSMPAVDERRRILMQHFEQYIGYVPVRDVVLGGGARTVKAWGEAWPDVVRNASAGTACRGTSREERESAMIRAGIAGQRRAVELIDFSSATLDEAVRLTAGFSGREIAKVCSAVQCRVFLNAARVRERLVSHADTRTLAKKRESYTYSSSLSSKEFLEVLTLKMHEHSARSSGFTSRSGGSSATHAAAHMQNGNGKSCH